MAVWSTAGGSFDVIITVATGRESRAVAAGHYPDPDTAPPPPLAQPVKLENPGLCVAIEAHQGTLFVIICPQFCTFLLLFQYQYKKEGFAPKSLDDSPPFLAQPPRLVSTGWDYLPLLLSAPVSSLLSAPRPGNPRDYVALKEKS